MLLRTVLLLLGLYREVLWEVLKILKTLWALNRKVLFRGS